VWFVFSVFKYEQKTAFPLCVLLLFRLLCVQLLNSCTAHSIFITFDPIFFYFKQCDIAQGSYSERGQYHETDSGYEIKQVFR
jgi:hypothetical protein